METQHIVTQISKTGMANNLYNILQTMFVKIIIIGKLYQIKFYFNITYTFNSATEHDCVTKGLSTYVTTVICRFACT